MARTCAGCDAEIAGDPRRKWCSDKCRKRTLYSGTCVDCGGRTDGIASGLARAAERCFPCRQRWQHENARWTKEAIVAAFRSWMQEHGTAPNADDWRLQPERLYPPTSTVQDVFGSWSNGLEAADLPRYPVRYPGDDPAVVAETVRLYRDEGLSSAVVAARMGVSQMAILNRLEHAGVPRRAAWDTRRLAA